MFRYQRSILSLTNKSRTISVRFNSSVNNKLQLNNVTTPIEKEKSTSNEKKPEISFVPVISMPRTEFAHHSFFSLYRPLLGISAENETPFFSAKQKPEEEVEQEKLDMMLAVYMNDCIPFVEPSQLPTEIQGEDWRKEFLEAYQAAENAPETTQYTISNEVLEELKPSESSIPLPIFHMPESHDVLDYLTSVESNMKEKHAKLDAQESFKESRIKKSQILENYARSRNHQPRFYVTNNRNSHLRRYQQRWLLK